VRSAAVVLGCALGCLAFGQSGFTASLEDGGQWWGRLDLEVSKEREAAWTFSCHDRARFLGLLSYAHGNPELSLTVSWGKEDVLRVNAGAVDPRFLQEDDGAERLLRRMLNEFDMTYMIEGGSYRIVPRGFIGYPPPPRARAKIEALKSGAFNVEAKGVQSLDVLAEALALRGIGYTVGRGVKCSLVDVALRGATVADLASFVERAEPGMSVAVGERAVAVSARKRRTG
jgi:hypothetical protein